MTLSDLVDEYALHHITVKKESLDQLRYSVRSLERFHERVVNVSELSLQLLSPWLRSRYATVSPFTVKRERGDLVCLWNFARRQGYCSAICDLPSIKTPKRNPEAWTLEELSSLLRAAGELRGRFRKSPIQRRHYWRSFILAMYDTSARVTALACVAPADIDLKRRFIVLQPDHAKTGLGQVNAISEQTADEIARIYDPDSKRVWGLVGRRRRFEVLRAIVAAAGLPAGRQSAFHRIRRTTATLLAKELPITDVSRVLGHTNPAMTLRYIDRRQLPETAAAKHLPRPTS